MHRRGFTLIELLVVIAIIAVLAVVVILSLNPAELLRQSRDSNRLNDMSTLNSALAIYSEDVGGSMGAASTTYISIPDSSATSTAGDQCQGNGVLSLGSTTWQCAASTSYRATNGTGWIPLNLSAISSGSPLGSLPLDPIDQTSSNLFYTYQASGNQYEVTAVLESQKYRQQFNTSPSISSYPGIYAAGSNLNISNIFGTTGLIDYWNFDEGTGSSTLDQGSNGNNGAWGGTASGNNGTYYTSAKIGSYAGAFDGSTTVVSLSPTGLPYGTASRTICVWFNVNTFANSKTIWLYGTSTAGQQLTLSEATGNALTIGTFGGGSITSASFFTPGTWANACFSFDGTAGYLYGNGLLLASHTIGISTVLGTSTIGAGIIFNKFSGSIDDMRIYNRVLSPAEILALYNAAK